MLDYVEVRQKSDRDFIGIIDTAKSIIWHSVYNGVGDFEIYAVANDRHLSLLQVGNYITRPDDIEVGIIEAVEITTSPLDGKMIIASGRFAKAILDRRHIYNLSGTVNAPTILRGLVEVNIRRVVSDNAINCSFNHSRDIPILELGELANIPAVIVDESGNPAQKQVSFDNLLDYTESVLLEYQLGAIITMDADTRQLKYSVYAGTDRSADNQSGNAPVIFSTEFDNLSETDYTLNEQAKKTAALIGGEGEGLERFYIAIDGADSGLERRETWVDASSISKKYKDNEGVEHTYTDAEYAAVLNAHGRQTLSLLKVTEIFDGALVVTGGIWRLNEDYMLGDIVTVQDNGIGKYANVRITETTEARDENGYSVSVSYKSI